MFKIVKQAIFVSYSFFGSLLVTALIFSLFRDQILFIFNFLVSILPNGIELWGIWVFIMVYAIALNIVLIPAILIFDIGELMI